MQWWSKYCTYSPWLLVATMACGGEMHALNPMQWHVTPLKKSKTSALAMDFESLGNPHKKLLRLIVSVPRHWVVINRAQTVQVHAEVFKKILWWTVPPTSGCGKCHRWMVYVFTTACAWSSAGLAWCSCQSIPLRNGELPTTGGPVGGTGNAGGIGGPVGGGRVGKLEYRRGQLGPEGRPVRWPQQSNWIVDHLVQAAQQRHQPWNRG